MWLSFADCSSLSIHQWYQIRAFDKKTRLENKTTMNILLVSTNYSGHLQTYQSINDGRRFIGTLSDLGVEIESVTSLIGKKATLANIKTELPRFLNKVERSNSKRGIVYLAGHGDQMVDRDGDEKDGMDEFWLTDDRARLSDDYLSTEIERESSLFGYQSIYMVISDHCSSGTMVDKSIAKKSRWISIGACRDRQSAIMTGDGGVMTQSLIKALLHAHEKDGNLQNLAIESLEKQMESIEKEDWSHIQDISFRYSHDHLRELTFFRTSAKSRKQKSGPATTH